MRKVLADFRTGMLGAAGGLFACSLFLLVARVDTYYAYLARLHETDYADFSGTAEGLWWMPIVLWHLILSVAASLFAHRYLTLRGKTTFLLWQIIGLMAILGWGLTFVLAVGVDALMRGDIDPIMWAFSRTDLSLTIKFVATALASNVMFGSIMQMAARHYLEDGARSPMSSPMMIE